MSPEAVLVVYCALIVVASLAGGIVPVIVRLTHRRMEIALSFVSGVMLGVAILHMLPHAVEERMAADVAAAAVAAPGTDGETHAHAHAHEMRPGEDDVHGRVHSDVLPVLQWLLAGFVVMFLLERFFCFHHHDLPEGSADAAVPGPAVPPPSIPPPAGSPAAPACAHGHEHGVGHDHALTWGGAAIGLTVHTVIAGVALAASVEADRTTGGLAGPAGIGTFLVIVLHKPFDALTIGTLMAAGRRSRRSMHVVNVLFSLTIALGALLFHFAISRGAAVPHDVVAAALAFSAGTFVCIALSDVLPELQFHRHDRTLLSGALMAGLAIAWALAGLE